MDHLESTACPFLEGDRTDVTKIAMAPFSIVKTLDVFEHIGSSFLAVSVTHSINTFTFEYAKETLNNRVDAPMSCQVKIGWVGKASLLTDGNK